MSYWVGVSLLSVGASHTRKTTHGVQGGVFESCVISTQETEFNRVDNHSLNHASVTP